MFFSRWYSFHLCCLWNLSTKIFAKCIWRGRLDGEMSLFESCIRAIVDRLAGKRTDSWKSRMSTGNGRKKSHLIFFFLVKKNHRLKHILPAEMLKTCCDIGGGLETQPYSFPLAKLTVSRYSLTVWHFLTFDWRKKQNVKCPTHIMAQNWTSSNDNKTCDTFKASWTWQEPERQLIEEKYFASVLAVRCSTCFYCSFESTLND